MTLSSIEWSLRKMSEGDGAVLARLSEYGEYRRLRVGYMGLWVGPWVSLWVSLVVGVSACNREPQGRFAREDEPAAANETASPLRFAPTIAKAAKPGETVVLLLRTARWCPRWS